MKKIELQATQAAGNKQYMEDFIKQNEFFILTCASSTVHHYVTKSDDEWSVALLGFSEAVMEFSEEKGSFIHFAKMVIRRRIIDYIRKQSKHCAEISVNPTVFEMGSDERKEQSIIKFAVGEKVAQPNDDSIKLEIEAVSQIFSAYGFSFFDLSTCSPKAYRTKRACAKVVAYIVKNPFVLDLMRKNKQLPIKEIKKNINVHRKILERHRKYIIAAVEIITGDYPCLAEYMRFIREELDK